MSREKRGKEGRSRQGTMSEGVLMWEWNGPAHEVNRPRRRGNSRDEIDPEKGKHALVGLPFLQRDARGSSVLRGY